MENHLIVQFEITPRVGPEVRLSKTCAYQQNLGVFSESLLFKKYNAQKLDIFHRSPSCGEVLVVLECHLFPLHALCLSKRYAALHQYKLADS